MRAVFVNWKATGHSTKTISWKMPKRRMELKGSAVRWKFSACSWLQRLLLLKEYLMKSLCCKYWLRQVLFSPCHILTFSIFLICARQYLKMGRKGSFQCSTEIIPLGFGCISGSRIWAGMASGCLLSSSPCLAPATPGMALRARKASPSKSSVLSVSWSRTVTTRQVPSAWHWSKDNRLWYKDRVEMMALQVHLKTEKWHV